MVLSSATSDSEADSDMPYLVVPEEVARIAEGHKVLAGDGAPRGNIVPFVRVIPRGRSRRRFRAKRR